MRLQCYCNEIGRGGRFYCCFAAGRPQVGRVSLNRSEQRMFDYLQSNRDEGHYWRQKVQTIAAGAESESAGLCRLEGELWRYYTERSAVASPFKEAARNEGLQRTSMRTLAELLVRLWIEPRARKRPANDRTGAEIPAREDGAAQNDA